MRIEFTHTFERIISVENLLHAWKGFLRGKRDKKDVQIFSLHLMDNILSLHTDLATRAYQHGEYESFFVNDPKRRHIHKACVRDRLVHHAVYRILYTLFDRRFISDSYSCREEKGIHKAINRFRDFSFSASKNHTTTCWVLKCDIRKFFASIDHRVLLDILGRHLSDKDTMWLLEDIICSFPAGLPLGNLTSQLFSNIYMNVFDQWMKHSLKEKFYIRYADDFVVLSPDKEYLLSLIQPIQTFLFEDLHLDLHPKKLFIRTIASGVDFLGWVHFPDHRVLRTVTRRRMMRRIGEHPTNETIQSYLGLMSHGNAFRVRSVLLQKAL